MVMNTEIDANALSKLIDELAPQLQAWGDDAETRRDLLPEAVASLRAGGFFRIWRPAALGGLELRPTEGLELFERLAGIDSASAWLVANASVITTFFQVFPDEGLDEIFAAPDTVLAGGWFPPGLARPTDGGYRVSGQWAFASGCRHADWLTGMAVVLGRDDQPEVAPDGSPRLLLFTMPASDADIVDNWDTLGMRGTGSHDIRVADAFVPERRTFPVGPFGSPGSAFTGPLYKFHMWLGGAEIGAVALGVARAALDDFTAHTSARVPSYTTRAVADRAVAQDHVGRAAALVGAGRAYVHVAVDEAYRYFESGGSYDPTRLIPVQLAACHAVEAASRAVDLLHAVAGTSGIRAEYRLERHLRDIHTIEQHTLAAAARYESTGQLLLGKQSDWMFFYL
jgi:indole-3-acetate monooxygenase